jgi:hypothetical protein
MARVRFSTEDPADVFIMAAIKRGLQGAYEVASMTPYELMHGDNGIDIVTLRKRFPGFDFFNGDVASEIVGGQIGEAYTAVLELRREHGS